MKSKIVKSFLWGALGPIIVIGFVTLLCFALESPPIKFERAQLWTIVFAFGICLSLWVQLAIARYFFEKELFRTTHLGGNLDYLEIYIWPIVMTLCVIFAIVTVTNKRPLWHLLGAVGYLLCVALWDVAEGWLAKPVSGKQTEAERFKACCRQLCHHIDAPALGIVVFWVLVFLCWENWLRTDGGEFAFFCDAKALAEPAAISAVDVLSKLAERLHRLSEPLLAGVIGFHMLVTVLLLLIHLYEWETALPAGRGTAASISRTAPAGGGSPMVAPADPVS